MTKKQEKVELAISLFADFFRDNVGNQFSSSELRKKKFVSNEKFKTFMEENFSFIRAKLQELGLDLKYIEGTRYNSKIYHCFKKKGKENEVFSERDKLINRNFVALFKRMAIVEKYLRENCSKCKFEQETNNEIKKREQKCSELASFLIENTNKFIMKSELSKAGIVSRNFKTFMEENLENIEKKLNSQGYELEVEKGEKTSVFYRCVKMRK